jgi:aspartyl protease family protein
MSLHDRDYWKERKNNEGSKIVHFQQIKPNKKQIHPFYSFSLALMIAWFLTTKLITNFPEPEFLPGKTSVFAPKLIPGGLIVYADAQGHFRGTLKINGIDARFMIDTGATTVAIPSYVAYQAGLKTGKTITVDTAGGKVIDYSSTVDRLTFGNALLSNVPVHINQHIDEILIGVDFMKHFKITHNKGSMELVTENGDEGDVIKALDPRDTEFNKIERMDGASGVPQYSIPSTVLTEKPRTTWTKSVTCDKSNHCKTSYH